MGQLIQESVGSNLPGSLALGLGGLWEGYTSFFQKCTKKSSYFSKSAVRRFPSLHVITTKRNEGEENGKKNEN